MKTASPESIHASAHESAHESAYESAYESIIRLFDPELPLSQQPRCLVDCLCQDESVLKEIHTRILALRQKHGLSTEPLHLIQCESPDPKVWLTKLKGIIPDHSDYSDHFGQILVFLPAPKRVKSSSAHPDLALLTFIMDAAQLGLFCKTQPWLAVKKQGLMVCHLEQRDYTIRVARQDDLDALVTLEQQAWSAPLRTTPEDLSKRLQIYPEGQCVLSHQDKIVGVVYAQRIMSVKAIDTIQASTVSQIHHPKGQIAQLMAVTVDPAYQLGQWGDELLEFMLQRCALTPKINTAVAVSLCRDFDKQDQPLETYIHQRNAEGYLLDPILRFHQRHGAEVVKPIRQYRPGDTANQGFGVLVRYDLNTRQPLTISSPDPAVQKKSAFKTVDADLEAEIKAILGKDRESDFDKQISFIAMGLDSLDITHLSQVLSAQLNQRLSPTFFFQYDTFNKVLAYLRACDSNRDPSPSQARPRANQDTTAQGAIAIIGLACRLPGEIDAPHALWDCLKLGKTSIGPLPEGRWTWPDGIDLQGQHKGIDRGGFLSDIARFDAAFFNLSPKVAETMDPQQRMLMELSWEALEDSGYLKAWSDSLTGVYIGASACDYHLVMAQHGLEPEAHVGTGTAMAVLANRLSYLYNFHGPSLTIDTACSSALVAVHTAVRALRSGECEQAVVGAVNLIGHPDTTIAYYKSGMLSKVGLCQTFDADADGYVRAEGGVVLVLKPLQHALKDHDRIYAVIKGTACNHGGLASGLTVPQPEQQKKVFLAAWQDAGITPESLTYVEMHGTGTKLGDPIECQSLKEAFFTAQTVQTAQTAQKAQICGVGSIKTNIGHLEAAAGMAGLLKVILCMQHREWVPSLHLKTLNPYIDWQNTPFRVVDKNQPWAGVHGKPLCAGVSSFGFGGVNAHIVLESYASHDPLPSSHDPKTPLFLFVLSAKTAPQLRQYAKRMLDYHDPSQTPFASWLYTLQTRTALPERLAFVVSGFEDWREKLTDWINQADQTDQSNERSVYRGCASSLGYASELQLHPGLTADALGQIAQTWVNGQSEFDESDWKQLYRTLPTRIWLPGYPFAGEKHWVTLTQQPKDSKNAHQTTSAIVVGAGLFGLCAAFHLKQAGISFKLFEKQSDLGGVWLVNQWPGCGCDIPMFAYAYSFQHYQGDVWAKQPAILAYLKQVAENHDLYPSIQLNTCVTQAVYDEAEAQWVVTLANGEIWRANYLIDAASEGLGHRPKMPDIPGMAAFQGELSHAVYCQKPVSDFEGRKVAVVGYGTTQIQLVEALQPVVDRLVVYARSPKYIYPRAKYADSTVDRLNRDYAYWLEQRKAYLAGADAFYHTLNHPYHLNPFHPDNKIDRYFNRMVDEHWQTFYDWLKAIGMMPSYSPGCSRPCMSASYHQQIRAENAHLETHPILRITETGIETDKGHEAFDVILFATGYDVNGFKPPFPLKGRGGLSLETQFQDFPRSYAGTLFEHFPNLFVGPGPHTSTNATSVTAMYEMRCAYILDLIKHCERQAVRSITTKPAAVNRFVDWVKQQNEKGSWHSGCSSWYQTSQGENAAIFPGNLAALKAWSLFDDMADYDFEQAAPKDTATLSPKPITQPTKQLSHTHEQVVSIVLNAFAQVTKADVASIVLHNPIMDYGIDSIILVAYADRLSRSLSKRIEAVNLFEHKTLADTVHYLETTVLFEPDLAKISDTTPILQIKTEQSEQSEQDGVAIVGLSGVFPQAEDLETFWSNLYAGRDCITEIPKDRWDWQATLDGPSEHGLSPLKWGGFLDGMDKFDPAFFHISPLEAKWMDPQHRLYLQSVYKAIEYSGNCPRSLQGKRIAVYYSANTSDYLTLMHSTRQTMPALAMQAHWHMFAPSRVSHMLGLTGPCEMIDTACSSAGVALKRAVDAILHDGCEAAIVGASNLMLLPDLHQLYSKAGMLSPDGRCKAFSASANGYVRGEAVAVVYLKKLEKARQDKDTILGLIRGISENHGGRSQGLTVPNVTAQADLIQSVFDKTGVDPRQVGLIECHGTGTLLGDPIEVKALKTAYQSVYRQKGLNDSFNQKTIGIGSVKSNIGHTEPVAALAGLFKVLLSLKAKVLPQSLHVDSPNPLLNLEEGPFYVLKTNQAWESPCIQGRRLPRMAGLSTFGVGNTNVHMLIEEYAAKELLDPAPVSPQTLSLVGPAVFVLSAKTALQLRLYVKAMLNHFDQKPDLDLHDFCYTLQISRASMPVRLSVVCSDWADLRQALQQYLDPDTVQTVSTLSTPSVYTSTDSDSDSDSDSEPVNPQGLSDGLIDGLIQSKDYLSLAKQWVQGAVVDWSKVFAQYPLQRLAGLPTYPFAQERYWLEPETPPKPNQRKVFLQDPLTMHVNPALMASHQPVKHDVVDDCIGVIRVDDGQENRLSERMLDALIDAFEALKSNSAVKVLLFMGNPRHFLSGHITQNQASAVLRRFEACLLDSPIPTIAVMQGSLSGEGFLLVALTDIVLCSQSSTYCYQQCQGQNQGQAADPSQAILNLTTRFNSDLASALCQEGRHWDGNRLQEACGIRALPKDTLEAEALSLAKTIGGQDALALALLKKQCARFHAPNGKNWVSHLSDQSAESPEPQLNVIKHIDIGSTVVNLTVYDGGILQVNLCDTESHNAFSEPFVTGVKQAFEHIAQKPEYRVVILTGYNQYFCTGGSKERLLAIQAGQAQYADTPLYEYPLFCKIPVIAAMQGHALGAGLSLGLFCDLTLFSEESIYSTIFMSFGFTPGFGSTLIFPEKLGHDLARELLFTAAHHSGLALKQRGLGLPVLPRAKLLPYAKHVAQCLARLPRETLVQRKDQAVQALREQLPLVVKQELAMHQKTFIGNANTLAKITTAFEEKAEENASKNLMIKQKTDAQQTDALAQALRAALADTLQMAPTAIEDRKPFVDLGLDSITGVMWIQKVNEMYGLSVKATEIYRHPTLEAFVTYLRSLDVEAHEKNDQTNGQKDIQIDLQTDLQTDHRSVETPDRSDAHQLSQLSQLSQFSVVAVPQDAVGIAIIGMAGQFPASENIEAYWDNIIKGQDCVTAIPENRWPIDQYYDPDPQTPGKTHCPWMGALQEVAEFDPLFFNLSPLEAESMDPQQRLLLQNTWHCLEDAGYQPADLRGSQCGVFIGCGGTDYGRWATYRDLNAQTLVGSSMAMFSARIAYLLNLDGPCLSIDTACSSSLVAVAAACDSLLAHTSHMALVGGSWVMAGPAMHIMASKAGMLSKDGRCFTFDERANGFVPGEGVGVICLKRLADAERDGDTIYGVIRGWGVNQDGRTNGITAPNPDAQTRLQRAVYDRFKLDPQRIELIEAHGTGTALGDPMEVDALNNTFQHYTHREHFCALGSVKTNVGHLLTAAGVAGLMKLVLALHHRMIPPTIHFSKQNALIDLTHSPFYISTAAKPWPMHTSSLPYGAINSFGFGGTNAHVVVQAYREEASLSSPLTAQITHVTQTVAVILSTKHQDRLRPHVARLLAFIQKNPLVDLRNLAYTLQVAREAMPCRIGWLVDSLPDLVTQLTAWLNNRNPNSRASNNAEITWLSEALSTWQNGGDVNWKDFYQGKPQPRRIRLPHYPFAKTRYWQPFVDGLPNAERPPHKQDDNPFDQMLEQLANQHISVDEALDWITEEGE